MASQDNAQIVRAFIDAFNNHEFDRVPEFIADNADWVDVPSGARIRGPEGSKRAWQSVLSGFPDYTAEMTNLVADGDWMVAEFIVRGTDTGPFSPPSGEQLPATGRRIDVRCCDILQLKNGKIVAGREYYDMATILRQLGLTFRTSRAA